MGCAWRGATARDGGEPSSALAVPAGSRADCGPERGERDCRGLGGRARGSPPAPSSAALGGTKGAGARRKAGGVGRRCWTVAGSRGAWSPPGNLGGYGR
jgi:hypothetical protein